MGEITVSVLCTAYNHEKYIRKCLEGFVQQKTNFAYEVLVNDDASTDTTPSIIREYEMTYPDIIKPLYQSDNLYSKGVKITRDILFPKSQGKYIAICEGDDYWIDPYKLQKQVDALEKNQDCSMCVCKVKIISEDETRVEGYFPDFPLDEGVITSEAFLNIVLRKHAFQTSSYMLRADLYRCYAKHTPEFVRICPVGDVTYLLYFGYSGNVYYCEDIMSYYRRGSIGGWSERIWSDRNRTRRNFEGMVKTYESFNRFSGGKYHNQCNQKVFLIKYYAAQDSKDYFRLLQDKEHTFLRQSPKMKIRILLGVFCNPLLKLYYVITKRIQRSNK